MVYRVRASRMFCKDWSRSVSVTWVEFFRSLSRCARRFQNGRLVGFLPTASASMPGAVRKVSLKPCRVAWNRASDSRRPHVRGRRRHDGFRRAGLLRRDNGRRSLIAGLGHGACSLTAGHISQANKFGVRDGTY